MTDLEMVKRCADRMDYKVALDIHGKFFFVTDGTKQPDRMDYDPLTNDAQAMALVKRFPAQTWTAIYDCAGSLLENKPFNINRAIVECVARLPC